MRLYLRKIIAFLVASNNVEILESLFESISKTRILRIFMRNSSDIFTLEALARRSGLRASVVKKELQKLQHAGIISLRKITLREELPGRFKSGKKKFTTRKAIGFFANPHFELFLELRQLFTKASLASKQKIAQKIKALGKGVKLAVVSGIFLNNEHSRIDLLVVGNGIKKSRFEKLLAGLEADMGKQLRYALMDSKEFSYRMDMYDRFLRDILEIPHEKLINKINA